MGLTPALRNFLRQACIGDCRGGAERVCSLRFGAAPSDSDWLRADGWALSTEPAGRQINADQFGVPA